MAAAVAGDAARDLRVRAHRCADGGARRDSRRVARDGDGLGYYIVVSRVYSDYTGLWAGAAVLTAVSLLFYSLVTITERAVLARFAPGQLT